MPINGFKEREKHESYGMAGFYRQSSSAGHPLFGSSIKHRDTICLRIGTAYMQRGLNTDWYYKDKEIIEVEMSQSQFADLITSLNQGEGIPVTITRLNGKTMEKCPFENKGEMHLNEYKDHLKSVNTKALHLMHTVKEIFDTKKTFTKKDKEEVMSLLTQLYNEVQPNEEYMVTAYQEQMNKTCTEAKAEIEAFFNNKINTIAQNALIENADEIKKISEKQNPVEFDG